MNRLWVRLAGAFLAVALLAVVGVAVVVDRATESSFRSYIGRQNMLGGNPDLPAALEAHYAASGTWDGADALLPGQRGAAAGGRGAGQGPAQGRGEGPGYLLAAADGTILVANNAADVQRPLTGDERDRAVPLVVEGRTVGYLSRTGVEAQALDRAEQRFLDEVSTALALAAVGAIALALVLALGLSWALLRPLRALQQSSEAIARGDLGAQMTVTGPTEYRTVASAFNRMSAALAESTALRQRMTSDIAHELRAPVSVMRAQLEAMLDGVFPLNADQLAIVYDETLHLGRLIEALRTLTRPEAGRLPLNFTAVDPAALAQRVATEFLPLAQDQQIALDTAIEPDLPAIRAGQLPALKLLFCLARAHPWLAGTLLLADAGLFRRNPAKALDALASLLAEPDRRLLAENPPLRERFAASFVEAYRQGIGGAMTEAAVIARPRGFRLEDIAIPVHVYQGGLDRHVPPTMGRHIAQALPQGRLRFYPDEGHLSIVVNHFADCLGDFQETQP